MSALKLFVSDMIEYSKWFKKLKLFSYGCASQPSSVALRGHICEEYFHMAYIKKLLALQYQQCDFSSISLYSVTLTQQSQRSSDSAKK